jgi:hypothetical protein
MGRHKIKTFFGGIYLKKIVSFVGMLVVLFTLTACEQQKKASDASQTTKTSVSQKQVANNTTKAVFKDNRLTANHVTIQFTKYSITPPGAEGNPSVDKAIISFEFAVKNISNQTITTENAWKAYFKASQAQQELVLSKTLGETAEVPAGQVVNGKISYELVNASDAVVIQAVQGKELLGSQDFKVKN